MGAYGQQVVYQCLCAAFAVDLAAVMQVQRQRNFFLVKIKKQLAQGTALTALVHRCHQRRKIRQFNLGIEVEKNTSERRLVSGGSNAQGTRNRSLSCQRMVQCIHQMRAHTPHHRKASFLRTTPQTQRQVEHTIGHQWAVPCQALAGVRNTDNKLKLLRAPLQQHR